MSVMVVEKQEDKCGRIGRENIDGVPLGRTATAASMAPNKYLAEEQHSNNHPAHNIGCGI